LSLATHTSGFPKTPRPLLDSAKNRCNPYRDMSRANYEVCIINLTGKKKPDPNNFEYSNMGFSVLANCLETKAGCRYDSLLAREIFKVLGMNRTTLDNTDTVNFATGYDKRRNETCHWDLPSFYAGCGAIRSNMSDMLKFLQANINENPLYKPFSETQHKVYKSTMLGSVGKAWEIRGDNIIWHNGGTGGFRSFIGLLPDKKIGVVVLSNQESNDLDMLGFDLVTLASRVTLK
jgi:D-alanyl-D-alanine-carboxypeptidase/D-alanyl-D-alanine-endopeptidase